jgi:hypothetical protein
MTDTHARRSVRDSDFWQNYTRVRYAALFYSLLMMLLAIPTAAIFGLPQLVMKLFFGACLLAAVLPNGGRRTRLALTAGVLLLVAARFTSETGDLPVHSGLVVALVGLTGLLAAAGAFRFAVSARTVNRETLYAALSTYLLAGIFFGQIYWSIERTWPGSLTGPDEFSEPRAVYYSFVTLATLGYGDYLPRTDLAQGVAVFEVVGGQLYLAVMVALLIGAFGGTRG